MSMSTSIPSIPIIDDSPLPRRPRGGRNRPKPAEKDETPHDTPEQKTPPPLPEPSATETIDGTAAALDHLPQTTDLDGPQPLQYSLGKRKRRPSPVIVQEVCYTHPYFARPISISSDLSPTPENAIDANAVLPPDVRQLLKAMGYSHLFPVQSTVIPILMNSCSAASPCRLRDILVSAPTGSGKTLSYAIPLVQALQSPSIIRIRALVVLPTRDLAAQVRQVFTTLAKGTGIKIGFAAGAVSFSAEQASLVNHDEAELENEHNGSSKVDILVATPGRLVDHLRMTPGFTLRHLRYLVIDEADKLLGCAYQGWVSAVLNAVQPDNDTLHNNSCTTSDKDWTGLGTLGWQLDEFGLPRHRTKVVRRSVLPVKSALPHHAIPLQKLLFSATLTQNPAKLAPLKLYHPVYVAVTAVDASRRDRGNVMVGNTMDLHGDEQGQEANPDIAVVTLDKRYTVPSTLTEHLLVVPDEYSKPLAVIYLLYILKVPSVLMFCTSIDSTHRLATFLNIYADLVKTQNNRQSSTDNADTDTGPVHATMLTSDLPRLERKKVLERFTKGEIQVLVASDLLTRGTDLGPAIKTVISYDVPTNAKTYIHRVGRTARAGASGVAYVFALPNQARHAKILLKEVGRERSFKRDKWDADAVAGVMELYKEALKGLGKAVKGDVNNHSNPVS
ncbi:hypothetical protein SeMB42_g04133 [Synchytrium endobioticum]|uniref:ATP-dependent RNA helicase n=1 Tax=Synchytrium endobioticum TaxID=286115 RepID=A0A507CW89_9FUNG|nr:hypothetical protein SeLEV6574_g05094 [Synchytrium endobioticum]TPX45009.1 hypothetical protein SeMB42_g04133 [Synchytrium endobioticum]